MGKRRRRDFNRKTTVSDPLPRFEPSGDQAAAGCCIIEMHQWWPILGRRRIQDRLSPIKVRIASAASKPTSARAPGLRDACKIKSATKQKLNENQPSGGESTTISK